MGELYKALTRNMNLAPVGKAIGNYIKKQKQQEALSKYINLLRTSQSNVEDIYNPTGVNNAVWEGGEQPPRTADLTGGGGNAPIPEVEPNTQQPQMPNIQGGVEPMLQGGGQTKTQQLTGGPQPPDVQMDEQPSEMILGDVKTGEPEQFAGMNKEANKELISFLTKAIGMEDLPPEKLEQGSGLLQQLIRGEQPKEPGELKAIDPTKDIYQDGKLVKPGTPKAKDKKLDKVIDERIDAKGNKILTWQKPDRETYDENKGKVRDSRSVTNVNLPKEDKWKGLGPILTAAQQTQITNDSGKVVDKTEQEIQRDKATLYNTALEKMIPTSIQWYNQKVKDDWGRENLSEADFYAEIEEGIENGEFGPEGKINEEAVRDLLDFGAFRRYMFDLQKESKKAKKDK